VVPTIVSKVEQDPATPILVERQQGCREGVLVEKVRLVATEVGESEANASSLPELETDTAAFNENPLRTALDNLTRAREARLVREQRERFEKISARFDAYVAQRRRLREETHQCLGSTPFKLMAAVVSR
jgi:hypothetical protein